MQNTCLQLAGNPNGSNVTGQEFGDPGPGQPGVVWSMEQRVCVGTEAGVRVAAVEVVGD